MNIFYANFHLGWGGQPLQVLQLAGAMQKRGHKVMVFSPPESDLARRSAEAGIPVETCCSFRRGLRPAALYNDIKNLVSKANEVASDIIHCHGSQDTWTSLAATKFGNLKAKLIRTKHNSYKPSHHPANWYLYNHGVAHTIAVAGSIKDQLVEGGFVKDEKVSVIHAGLDDNFVTESRTPPEAIRRELHIPQDAFLIGLVGRLAPDKGQDTLLYAAKKVLAEIPNAHFLLVGTGGDWDRIRGLINKLNLQEKVTWAGFRSDVSSVTAALDVSLLAARACDASSTVLKEAMVLGVPVVATDVGGTREIVKNGECGELIIPGDSVALAYGIINVYLKRDVTEKRVNAAKEHVKQFLASEIARKTEDIYREVLEKSGRALG